MSKQSTLAEALVQALCAHGDFDGSVAIAARVLAEHDTAPSSGYCGCRDLGDGTGMECVAHEEQRLALEAAEARCAQVEQARTELDQAIWGAGVTRNQHETVALAQAHQADSELVDAMEAKQAAIQAERERLRAALRDLRSAPEAHADCVQYETEGMDNAEVYTVDERCALCREIDAALAPSQEPAQ